jgi:hypothetical protein
MFVSGRFNQRTGLSTTFSEISLRMRAAEGAMVKAATLWLSGLMLAIAFSKGLSAQAECDHVYGLCMAGCTIDRMAVRCMQRCDGAKKRCGLSGSFAMEGAGFLLLHDKRLDRSVHRELHEHPTPVKRNAE